MEVEIPSGNWKLIAGEGRCAELGKDKMEVIVPQQAGFAMFRNNA